jgi:hypothetical protein
VTADEDEDEGLPLSGYRTHSNATKMKMKGRNYKVSILSNRKTLRAGATMSGYRSR